MNGERIGWDCDPNADEQRKFTVEDGQYVLTVWEVIPDSDGRLVQKSKKAGDDKLNIKFGINGQEGAKWLYHNITFIPKGKPGHFIAVHAMKTLGISVDKGRVNLNPAELVGKVCRADIATEEYPGPNGGKRYKNVIKEMLYPMPDDKPELPLETAAAAAQQPAGDDDVPF